MKSRNQDLKDKDIRFVCKNNLTWIGRKLSSNGFPSELSKFRNLEEIMMISINNLIVASFFIFFILAIT